MSQFNDFSKAVLDQLKDLAVGTLKDELAALQEDAKAFLKSSEAKLKKWGQLVLEGKLDEEDLAFLVRSQLSLAKLDALTKAGLSAIRLKKLRDQITDIIVKAAFATFLP